MAQDKKSKTVDRLQCPIIPVGQIGFHCETSWSGPNKKVVLLIGDSGIGKTTELDRYVREDMKVKSLLLAMANFIEGAEWGCMIPDQELDRLHAVLADFLQEIQDSPEPGVLIMDDIGRCDDRVLKHIFSLVDSRMRKFMQFHLPDNWCVALTMNPASGSYDTSTKFRDPAIRRRLRYFWVEATGEEYLHYATQRKKMLPVLVKYLRSNPGVIHDVKTRDNYDGPYGCPAAWDDVDDVLKGMIAVGGGRTGVGSLSKKHMALLEPTLASMVGLGTARQVAEFLQKNVGAIDPEELLRKYANRRSNVHRQVVFHMGAGNNTVLSELLHAVALNLRTYPDAQEVVPSLALFLEDLANAGMKDLMQVFFRKLRPEAGDSDEYKSYLEGVGKMMFSDPSFKGAARALLSGLSRMRDDFNAQTP